jgi:hypothetical protein
LVTGSLVSNRAGGPCPRWVRRRTFDCFVVRRQRARSPSVRDPRTRARRFPLPWSVEDVGAEVQRWAFVVKDANGQALAYVYFEDEPGRRSTAKLLS